MRVKEELRGREERAAVAKRCHDTLTEEGREEGGGGGSQRKRQAYKAEGRAAAMEIEREKGKQAGAAKIGARGGGGAGGIQGGGLGVR